MSVLSIVFMIAMVLACLVIGGMLFLAVYKSGPARNWGGLFALVVFGSIFLSVPLYLAWTLLIGPSVDARTAKALLFGIAVGLAVGYFIKGFISKGVDDD